MSSNELAAQVAAESIARIKQADDEALLAAEAFAMGLGPKYLQGRQYDINRRINERFGTTGDAISDYQFASPGDFGKPAA